jgi:hypothetical protein
MTDVGVCDNCGEELPSEPIRYGERVFCCEACAFEASRSADCGGRTDSTFSPTAIEQPETPELE